MGNQVPSNRGSLSPVGCLADLWSHRVDKGLYLLLSFLAQSSEDLSVRGKSSSALQTYPTLPKEEIPSASAISLIKNTIQLQSRKQHHRGHLDGLWLPVNFLVARRGALLISRCFTCEALKNQSQMTSKDNNRLKEYCLMSAIWIKSFCHGKQDAFLMLRCGSMVFINSATPRAFVILKRVDFLSHEMFKAMLLIMLCITAAFIYS